MATSEVKNVVLNIAGRKVSLQVPTDGQFLRYDFASQSWKPMDIGTFTSSIISDFDTKVDARIALQKAQPNGLATLGPDGKIPSAQIPALAITRVEVVNSEAAQLALTGMEAGDVVVRTDISKTYIHNGGTAGTMADYTEILSPPIPVQSVNGQTGNVVLTTDNIAEGAVNLYFTTARVQAVAVGGDLTGTVNNATVAKLRNIAVSAIAPTNGQVLAYNSATNQWEPKTLDIASSQHTHQISDVTGLQAALDAKANQTDLTALNARVTTAENNITTLQNTKADINHTHAIADVTGLQAALDSKLNTATYNQGIALVPKFTAVQVTYSANEFKANSSTVRVPLLSLPQKTKLVGISIKHDTAFAGPGFSAVNASVGSNISGNYDDEFYSMQFDVFQAPSDTRYHDVDLFLGRTWASHEVMAVFTANKAFGDGTSTDLTAGSVMFYIGYIELPSASS